MLLRAIGIANLRILLPRGPFNMSKFVFFAIVAIQFPENARKFRILGVITKEPGENPGCLVYVKDRKKSIQISGIQNS